MAVDAPLGPTLDLPGLRVTHVRCLTDNYAWLLEEGSGKVAVVDPSEAGPVAAALQERGDLKLDYIINTHHHWDHVGGNEELKRQHGAEVVGPKADEGRIPGIDVALPEGDAWRLGGLEVRVFDTPGHTRGHVSYYLPSAGAVFTGDTLFSLGCGRLFEGQPDQMWASLSKLAALPPDTLVFCGHEYTQSNAKFARHVDPGNEALAHKCAAIDAARSKGEATVPSRLGEELATNPFLRPHSPAIRQQLGVASGAGDAEAFAAIRKAKDSF